MHNYSISFKNVKKIKKEKGRTIKIYPSQKFNDLMKEYSETKKYQK